MNESKPLLNDNNTSPADSFYELFQKLSSESRVFPLQSQNIKILSSPTEFYEQLIANIKNANNQISISSLYLGTGTLEKQLIECLAMQLRLKPDLKVRLVFDFSRGQRGGQTNSSVSMLKDILLEFPDRLELSLYKVPQLNGLKGKLPPPFNETIGVSHSKVYLVDDTLIISGANLSSDYFTNRQDRYVQLSECEDLATFYHDFVSVLADYSYRVNIDSENNYTLSKLTQESSNTTEPSDQDFATALNKLVSNDGKTELNLSISDEHVTGKSYDTWALPTVQFSPIGVTHDENLLRGLISALPASTCVQIASGYFNFPSFLSDLLLQSEAKLEILTAAPKANGFFNARGIKGAVPMAYSLIEQDFYERSVQLRGDTNYTTLLREFNRSKWTFHAKGLWCSTTSDHLPKLTIVGSSNFGQRSYGCDLESQVFLLTKNPRLQQALKSEYDNLIQYTERVTDAVWKRPDRQLHGIFGWKYGHWIKPVTKFIAQYL